ncbi:MULTISPECIES: ABATE domain-containing protein [unclassified Nocardia]|uniref:CGNR zinc finger domain-containing protein n=1 Tax=unclassified Nocardia TaxID=2637762 RepID=UPI001CE424A9|nr:MULTISPECIES: ABATE domain-containing protein [unclassified Nocardia]
MELMHTFVSGNLALDFAGTVRGRTTYNEDTLTDPAAFGRWTVAASVLDQAPDCDAPTLDRAIRVREASYRLALAAIRGTAADDADRAVLNAAAGELPTLTLQSDGTLTRSGDANAAISAIARAALELLGTDQRHRIKECGRAECTRLYVDTSRGGSRRWCDMTGCGNRAKSAAFRARHAD